MATACAAPVEREEWFMQVVVVRSPKALRGILRLLFRIKKDTAAT
jgi:hypothetical protein